METLNYLELTFDLMCVYIHWKSRCLKSFSWNEIDTYFYSLLYKTNWHIFIWKQFVQKNINLYIKEKDKIFIYLLSFDDHYNLRVSPIKLLELQKFYRENQCTSLITFFFPRKTYSHEQSFFVIENLVQSLPTLFVRRMQWKSAW